MSDAKRTPYRQPDPAPPTPTRARGSLVRRPDEEETRPAAPAPTPVPPPDPDAGVFSGLVSPHPASSGAERIAQIVLTAIGLPLILATFVTIGWLDTRYAYERVVRRGQTAPKPLGIAHPGTWLVGAAVVALIGFASQTAVPFTAIAIGVPFLALYARREIRARIVDREALRTHLRDRRANR